MINDDIPKYIDTISKFDKLYRLIWRIVSLFLFKPFSLPFFNGWRIFLLKCFGAKIGNGSIVFSSAYIPSPKNLQIGCEGCISPEVKLHFGKTIIGNKVTISQTTYLCSATHLITSLIKDFAWTAAESFIMSNVTIGRGTVIGVRAAVFKDVEDCAVVCGNPC